MADHSKPTVTSTYVNFVSELDTRFDDLAVGLDPAVTTATNLPTNAIRWNSAGNNWQKWNGTAWGNLSSTYAFTSITATTDSTINASLGVTGNLTVDGNTTLGNASGDTVTVNAASITIPNATTVSASNGLTFTDSQFVLADNTDSTKKAQFELSGITTGTTRTYTLPNTTTSLAGLATAQTFSAAQTFSSTVTMSGTTTNIALGTSQTTGTWTAGGTAQTGAMILGQSTGAQTVSVANGATTNGTTKTVNIGANGVSGSTTNINIGSAVSGATGTLLINSPLIDTVAGVKIGIGHASPVVSLDISATDSIRIPVGTDAQRPTGVTGYLRFNSTSTKFEGYNGSSWTSVGGGATGSGSDDIFIENGQTVTQNYTLSTGKNAGSFGPISINSGVTVTVPSGQTWTVV